jgi:hypothetical protein
VTTASELINLCEMARIGNYSFKNNQFEVWIYHEHLKNPSFHFKNKTLNYEVVLQLKDLKPLEWKTDRIKIPIQHLRYLVEWFKQPSAKNPKITNWERLAYSWDDNNIDDELPTHNMPDFDAILANSNPTD